MAKKKTTNKNSKTKTKKEFNFKNPIIIGAIVLLILGILSYFLLGLVSTIILIVGIALILGIAKLFDKCKTNKKKKKLLNILLIGFLSLCIIGCVLVCVFVLYVIKDAPEFKASNLDTPESTVFYDTSGNVMAQLGTEKREKVTYNELPQVLIDAIIATEDSRFYQHNGFDAPRFIKASLGQVAGRDSGGASTLSMQVVKNSFTDANVSSGFKGIVRKFTDIYLAIFKLEKDYTKEEIFEFYVNNHFLGGNVYGVEQASWTYFGKSVKDLNLSEAAILAGMFKSPNYYMPNTYPEHAKSRRNTVLYLMARHGYITEEEADLADSIPVESLVTDKPTQTEQFQDFIDTAVAEIKKKYNVNPYTTPLLVYTTMDRDKQIGVNKVMSGETFKWVDEVVQSGVSAVDTNSGKILAIGAGRNRTGLNGFSFASSDDMKRQPGSSAKPLFDYAPGFEYNNWSTYTLFNDEPYSYTGGKQLQNWDGTFMGTMTLRTALALSRNIPALKAFQQVDNKKIVSFVTSLGITPEISNGKVHEAHSIGSFNGVNPLQMSAAYAAFANGGYYYEPYSVSKIVFRDTNETFEHTSEKVKVMSDSTAFLITSVLQDVEVGRIRNVTFASKTGTTNYDEKTMIDKNMPRDAINDSWVVGYTPNISIGMWYGYDEIDPVYCSHMLSASNIKNKLFVALGEAVFDKDNKQFNVPNSVVKVGVEMGSNPALLPSENTPKDKIVYEYFIKGTEPTEVSDKYKKINTPGNFTATYDKDTKKVKLTWNKVSATNKEDSYGPFGYFVYKDNKLIDFTEKTTYTIDNATNPNGTYKVIASFKNYDQNQSNPATFTLKIDSGGDSEQLTYSAGLKSGIQDNTIITVGTPYTIPNGKDIIIVYEDDGTKKTDITSKATIASPTIMDGNNQSISAIDTSKKGVYIISYKVTYKTFTKTISIQLTIN